LGNQTLVPNGDFSAGLAGWTVFPNGVGNFVASPAAGPDGNPGTALAITGPSGIPVASPGYALGQGVSVTPGETYVLSGYVQYLTGATGNAYIDLNDVTEDPNALANPLIINQWQFVYAPFVATSGTEFTRLVRDSGDSPNDQVLFDRIAITPIASFVPAIPVPLPSAALGGLVLIGALLCRNHVLRQRA